MRKYLYNHTSFETAYVIKDWPWGYKLRTEKRFWIESNKNGDRLVSQTLDPRTNKYCAPKKSVYYPVKILYTSESETVETQNGEVEQLRTHTLSRYVNDIKSFYDLHKDNLNDFQKAQIKELICLKKAMENVTFEFKPVLNLQESIEIKQKNEEILEKFSRHVNHLKKTIEL